ncbi:MAG: hypothetical protein WC924_02460 [Candidatus Gracilibacteria bacterium]
MQKLTLFSVLLSISVVLIVGDIVYHDYLSEFETSREILPVEGETSDAESVPVDLSEEDPSLTVLESSLSSQLFTQAGFLDPVLKDTVFSGLVFQFISFADQDEATLYQWNLFDGEQYIGSIYEIKYPTETGSFQGYLALRERAMSLTAIGTVNEANNYGDACFYFNHKTKVKTVHLVIRTGADIYGFEYGQSYHEKMKNVFDSLSPLL